MLQLKHIFQPVTSSDTAQVTEIEPAQPGVTTVELTSDQQLRLRDLISVEIHACGEDESSVSIPSSGGWTTWTAWSECSATCGQGVIRRTRECIDPTPEERGRACPGKNKETRPCDNDCSTTLAPITTTETCEYNIVKGDITGTFDIADGSVRVVDSGLVNDLLYSFKITAYLQ